MATRTQTVRQTTLENGMTVVHEAMPWLPSVSFEILMPVGTVGDTEGLEGSATVLHDWMTRGAAGLSSRDFNNALENLGVRRGGGAGLEYATFKVSMLADAFPEALRLYADALRAPNLAPDEFEGARSLAFQELASLEDSPTQRLFLALNRRYFASEHGRSPYGSEEGLKALTPESVRADWQRRVAPSDIILSVAGGIGWEQVVLAAERYLGDWQGRAPSLPEPKLAGPGAENVEAETSQTQIGVAYPAVAPKEPGWYENALANQVLGGGMSSRLFTEVREKRGLVYSVAAVGRALKGLGYTLGYAGTTPERADETLRVLLSELAKLNEGVTASELERAKVGMLSSLVMQGESSGARASALARDIFLFGNPRTLTSIKTAIDSIGLDALNAFLAARPEPQFTIMTLGPEALELSS